MIDATTTPAPTPPMFFIFKQVGAELLPCGDGAVFSTVRSTAQQLSADLKGYVHVLDEHGHAVALFGHGRRCGLVLVPPTPIPAPRPTPPTPTPEPKVGNRPGRTITDDHIRFD